MKADIRLADEGDTYPILDLYIHFINNTVITFETEVPSENEFNRRIQSVLDKLPWLVCYVDGVFAGYAYATDHRSRAAYQWTKEVSVYVSENFRAKKVATGLYTSLLEILKLQGISNCLAGIALPNAASIKFHESMGFRHLGTYHKTGFKMGRFIDVGWWEKFLQAENFLPAEIINIRELQAVAAFNKALRMGIEKIQK